MVQTVFVHLPAPFAQLQVRAEEDLSLEHLPIPQQLQNESTYFQTTSSRALHPSTRLIDLQNSSNPSHPISLSLNVRVLGGKGGFGSNLRAAGGRMSTGKANNIDACRDLSGRRLSTIKEAKRQAELLEAAPALRAAALAADKAKLEALERALGISSGEANELIDIAAEDAEAENNGEGSSSSAAPKAQGSSNAAAKKRIQDVDIEAIARKKYKFDDNKFLEESREINDNVRSAVAAGLLKKKKKPKAEDVKPSEGKGKAVAGAVKKAAEKDKVAMPPPASAKTTAVA